MMPHRILLHLTALALALLLLPSASEAQVQTVDLAPMRDNTLYEEDPGLTSNGVGEYLFVGVTEAMGGNAKRRALLAFDIDGGLPNGAMVMSATLTLNMSMSIVGETNVTLHRLTSDWGEAGSDAPGQEGRGTGAQIGDATWTDTFFDSANWTTAGGDFVTMASATTPVAADGSYTWGPTTEMTADVQAWVNDPSTNFGWIVIGDEVLMPTAKRFDSRENATASNRPVLRVEFVDTRIFEDGFETGDVSVWSSSFP